MAPQISVKGAKIRGLGDDLVSRGEAALTPVANQLSGIEIGFPAFGVLGLPLMAGHAVVRNQASNYATEAKRTLERWRTALNETARTWDEAERSSTANTP